MPWTVIGHEAQKAYVDRLIASGGLSHAYLLNGPGGVGKRMFAEDVLRTLHGNEQPLSRNPDHQTLEPGLSEETGKQTDIAVADVRAMKAWAYQKPLYGSMKTVLVCDADRLGEEAANTFLKVLEEPPAYLLFLLTTSKPGRVLRTIASRCQEMKFGPLSVREMNTVLSGVHLDADDRQLLTTVAAGRPGVGLALIHDRRLPEVARAIAQFEQLLKAGVAERLIASKSIVDEDGMADTISWWLAWVHAQLPDRPQLSGVAHALLELSDAVDEPKFNRRLALDRFLLELN